MELKKFYFEADPNGFLKRIIPEDQLQEFAASGKEYDWLYARSLSDAIYNGVRVRNCEIAHRLMDSPCICGQHKRWK